MNWIVEPSAVLRMIVLILKNTDLESYPLYFRSFPKDVVSNLRQTCVSNLQPKHVLLISIKKIPLCFCRMKQIKKEKSS